MPSSMLLRKTYYDNLTQLLFRLMIEFHASAQTAEKTRLSVARELFESSEYERFHQFKQEQFKALLKTIAGVR